MVGDLCQAHEALVGHAEPHVGDARARDIDRLEALVRNDPGRQCVERARHDHATARFDESEGLAGAGATHLSVFR